MVFFQWDMYVDGHRAEQFVDESVIKVFMQKTNAAACITSGPDDQDWQVFFQRGTRTWLRESAVRSWIVESIGRLLAGGSFSEDDFEAQPSEGWEQIKSATAIIR